MSQLTKSDKQVLFFVALIWGADMLYYLMAIVMRLPVINMLADYFVASVIIFSIFITFRSLSHRFKATDYLFYIGCIMLYLINFALFPSNDKWLGMYFPMVFFQMLPYFFVGLLIEPKKQVAVIEYVSLVYIVLSLLYLYIVISNIDVESEEMGVAYALLPHLLVVLFSCFRRFRWYFLVVFLLGLFRLLGTGNRGTLVLLSLFVVLYFLFCTEYKHKFLASILLAIAVAFVWYRQDLIFGYLGDLLGGIGFNTRAIDMALNSEFDDANGRDVLSAFFIDKIKTGGLLGYGIFGDRTLLHQEDGYPHNLVLEFLIDYGIPFGSILLIALVGILIKSFKSCKTKESKSFLFIFLILGFFSLFLSNSYLSNPFFFLMIGYAVNSIRASKKSNANTYIIRDNNENTVS